MSASSSRPWMVPSSPNVPCSTGKITSTLMARSLARRVSAASLWNGTRPLCRWTGSGGTITASPRANTAAAGVVSGSPARNWRGSKTILPCSKFSACSAVSQRPSLVMPMGTTSYLSLLIAWRTDAAESSDTSCSPLRPPNSMPTRSFFMTFQCGRGRTSRQSQDWYIRTGLQNLFPKCRQRQFHGQFGGAVVLVDHGIHFDNLEADHAAVIGDDLHGEMGFAIGRAAADRSAYAGRVLGINPIHVERNVIAGGAAPGHSQSFFHDGAHAAFVNVAHGKDSDASAA